MKQHSLSPIEKRAMVVIMLLATSGTAATDIYIPSFPRIEEVFSTTTAQVQLTLSIYLLFFSLSPLIYGPLSDKIGRKKVALLGLFIGLIGTTVAFFSWNIASLSTARAIQGLGLGACMFLFRVILRDLFKGDRMAYYTSFITIAYSAMFALAPLLGGLFEHYLNWRISFVFLFFYLSTTVFFILYWLKETNCSPCMNALNFKVLVKNYGHIITNPIFVGYALCCTATFITLSAFLAETPFLLETVVGLTPLQFGSLGIVPAIALLIGGLSNAFFLRKIGRHRTLTVGIFILIFAALAFLLCHFLGILNTFSVVIPMTLSYLGAAFIFPNAVAGALTPFARIAGSAGALFATFQIMGGFVGAGLMAFFPKIDQLPLAGVALTMGILAYLAQKIAFHKATTSD